MNGRTTRLIGLSVALGALAALGASCKSSTDAPVKLTVNGPTPLTVGESGLFTFPPLTGATCTWVSSNNAVATVSLSGAADGEVTGVSIGTATVTVTCITSLGSEQGSDAVTVTAAPSIDGSYNTNFISSTSSCVVPATNIPFIVVGDVGYFSGNPGFSGPIPLTKTFTTNTATVTGIFTPSVNPPVFGGGCTGIPSVSFSLTFNMQSGIGSGDLVVTYPGKSAISVGVSVSGKNP